MNDELIHMLGYLTQEQWEDAFALEDLDKDNLKELLQTVDKRYGMEMYENIILDKI